MKRAGSESGTLCYGSANPDPHQNITDPQHCIIRVTGGEGHRCCLAGNTQTVYTCEGTRGAILAAFTVLPTSFQTADK